MHVTKKSLHIEEKINCKYSEKNPFYGEFTIPL